jgi:predicted nucleotidyltransferase
MDDIILNKIRELKKEIIPEHRLILFGSQARRDARPDSDWDLLILLNKEGRVSYEDENKYAYPIAELGFNYGKYFSVKVYTEKEWKKKSYTPFYKNVEAEGITI